MSIVLQSRQGRDVTDVSPGNGSLAWRVTVLEDKLRRLEDGKPDVVSERVNRLSVDLQEVRREFHEELKELREDDLKGLREELATQRRILVGSFISLATALIVAYAFGGGGVS